MDINNVFTPRGVRNNNPGNIRLSSAKWRGQKPVQVDKSFVEFETPLMGLRALMVLLLTYYKRFNLDTVGSILRRYAPPHENATDHYIKAVAARMGVGQEQRLDIHDPATLASLATAIVRHENGRPPQGRDDWYGEDLYAEAARLALNREGKT